MSRRLLASAVIVAAPVICLISGCGGSSTRTVTAVPSVTTTTASRTVTVRTSSGPTSCTDYLSGHSALVAFSSRSGDVTAVCRSWIKINAREGQTWIEAAPGRAPSTGGTKAICALEIREGAITAAVNARPDDVYGSAACAGLISAGWKKRSSGAAP